MAVPTGHRTRRIRPGFPYHGCALPTELGERLCSRYQQVTTGKVRHMGVGGALTSWHADDRSAAGTRRRPQSRAAGPRRSRRGPSGLGADLRRSLSPVRLRLAGDTEHAAWQGLFEIVALTGTLSQDRGHLHLAVAPGGCTWRSPTTRAAPAAAPRRGLHRAHHWSPWPPTTGWCLPRARSCHRLRRAGGPRV